jgi:hypothetical protein
VHAHSQARGVSYNIAGYAGQKVTLKFTGTAVNVS